jgi:L-amino acid N-acyltransferase YncA
MNGIQTIKRVLRRATDRDRPKPVAPIPRPDYEVAVPETEPLAPVTRKLPDGRRVNVRHICPEDAERLVELFWQLSTDTRWRRFFVPLDNVEPDLVRRTARRMAAIDRRREVALVAVTPAASHEDIVAVARFACQKATDKTAEGAIVVRDDYQGMGLGSHLLHLLIRAARMRGLRAMSIFTQGDNSAILTIVRRMSIPYTSSFAAGVYEITLHLAE